MGWRCAGEGLVGFLGGGEELGASISRKGTPKRCATRCAATRKRPSMIGDDLESRDTFAVARAKGRYLNGSGQPEGSRGRAPAHEEQFGVRRKVAVLRSTTTAARWAPSRPPRSGRSAIHQTAPQPNTQAAASATPRPSASGEQPAGAGALFSRLEHAGVRTSGEPVTAAADSRGRRTRPKRSEDLERTVLATPANELRLGAGLHLRVNQATSAVDFAWLGPLGLGAAAGLSASAASPRRLDFPG